ncbi:hypothetical protein M0811_07357 [Anaeramoeba ignava]|uniref:Uncharacterized protein n=1 Tax=Anaeramoeba ignava TaxID=1746090 RepID=A0A9Q0RCQ5_ANAIG|nr:hypothetical protein M0811_07357 [Anaeramoeba ignava]
MKIFNFIPWLIILLPPIILLISLIYQLLKELKRVFYDRIVFIVFILSLIYLIITFFFIGLKLDGFIQIKYSKLIYLLIIFEIYILYHIWKEIRTFGEFFAFIIVSLVIFIILLMLFLYGDGIIKKLRIALIPTYLLLSIPYFFSFIFFFYSGFKLILKIIKNDDQDDGYYDY